MAMVADPAFSAARSFRKVWGAIQVADAVQMVVSGNEPALYSSRAQFDYQPAADSEVWHPAAASFYTSTGPTSPGQGWPLQEHEDDLCFNTGDMLEVLSDDVAGMGELLPHPYLGQRI
jgi:hypothetical protein